LNKVVLGLSGGVDSSVAAYLLKEQGFKVHAVYMINWHDTEGLVAGSCSIDDDILVAQLVSRKLDIPFEVVDFSESYTKRVVDYLFSEYEKGRTPNPDILCNREIKFDVFLDKAVELGADFVATGHYCRKDTIHKDGKTIYRLLEGKDRNKDQSYFLCQLSQKQLEKALFPVGELQKSEVRTIAEKLGLASAKKKDSQGICFVGKVDLPTFLQQKLKPEKGDIILIPNDFYMYTEKNGNIESDIKKSLNGLSEPYQYRPGDGRIVGSHQGAHFYTIGQRRGLGVGGLKEPPFVLDIDTKQNIVFIGSGKEHPGLFRKGLFIFKEDLHWIRPDLEVINGQTIKISARIRYRQSLQKATFFMQTKGAYLIFNEAQRGITPGQFAAFYIDDELIGSGIIS
jgi:tRNA-specific 2-thiouridylase